MGQTSNYGFKQWEAWEQSRRGEINGALVYRLTAYTQVQTPCPATASFALPDGQELHSIA